ncbi:hypothetical protein Gpo141_00010358 [Globisporangium polare]
MEAIGGKRKYKENAFTAKAESGTLKVKILRKDMRNNAAAAASDGSGSAPLSGFLAATRATSSQQQKQQQQQQLLQQQHEQQQRSPPKPRPNRKHVPIFYQQKTPTTMMMESSSSSTDESMVGVSQSMSTTSTADYNESSTTSQDSNGGRFSSLLSGLHLDTNGGNGGLLRPPPPSNPLFSRNDSDGANNLFGSLLRQSFPSAQGPAPLGSFLHASSPLHHSNSSQGETASALHQLASSAYGSSLASLSSAARDISSNNNGSQSQEQQQGYRFNPFTALQSAIDVHQATISSSSSHAPYQYPHERQQYQGSESQNYAARQDASMGDDLGPPPSAPPAFAIQNSLMGGGIESQPVIANVNTHNFDWSNGTGRPRSGSLPNILEGTQSDSGGSDSGGKTGGGSNSTAVPSASNVHMWKEV